MPRHLLPFVFLTLLSQTASPQTFTLRSIDGTPAKITLALGKITEKYGRSFTITTDKDTLYLNEFWAIYTAEVINDNFLEITYAERGGSNLGITNYLLLSVVNHKLIESAFLLQISDWEAFEHKTYTVRPTLLGNAPENYRLALDFQAEANNRSGKWIFAHHHQDTLSFNPSLHIFYSQKQHPPTIHVRYLAFFGENLDYYYVNGIWKDDETESTQWEPTSRHN